MRIRLGQSTFGYAQSLTLGFLCFAFVGFMRQQNFFIATIHEISDSKSLFMMFDDVEHTLLSPSKLDGSSTKSRTHHQLAEFATQNLPTQTALHSCRIRNTTVTFPEVPSFIIIGAQKAGSSALADHLKLHPHIVGPSAMNGGRDKELHFLDWMIPNDDQRRLKQQELNMTKEEELWCYYRQNYADSFDLDLLRGNSSMITFEKTPSYMFHSYALPNILRKVCPWSPKLLAILRNPIDRSWSQYNMDLATSKKLRKNFTSFEALLELELASLSKLGLSNAPEFGSAEWDIDRFEVPNLTQAELDGAHKSHFRQVFLNNYLQRGMYAIQLRKWKDEFGSKLLVVRYEDLYGQQGQACYDKILDHVGVSRVPLPQAEDKHWSRQHYRHKLSNRTRSYLQLFFRPYNELLANLLGSGYNSESWS